MVLLGAQKPLGAQKALAVQKTDLGFKPQPTIPAGIKAPNRTQNASTLRQFYVEIMQSPDGADPLPLTVPKCVECWHCGFPVFPRESRVATQKTYARAGMTRKDHAGAGSSGAKPKSGDAEDGDKEGSEDSRDTVERLADTVEQLREDNSDLKGRNEELEQENEEMKRKCAELTESLTTAEEKVEFLEQAELRWRSKLSQAKAEIDKERLRLERASHVSADRESGLVAALQELKKIRLEYANFKRRRGWMLDREMNRKLGERDSEDLVAQVFRLWRPMAVQCRFTRQLQDVERRRRAEVQDLRDQLESERARTSSMEATIAQMRGRLRAAAHRLLQRSLGDSSRPWALAHGMRAWCAVHPTLAVENEMEVQMAKFEECKIELKETKEKHGQIQAEFDDVVSARDSEREAKEKLQEEITFMERESGTSRVQVEARLAAEKAKEEQAKQAVEQVEERLQANEVKFEEEREALQLEIKVLEGKLLLAEQLAAFDSTGPGTANGIHGVESRDANGQPIQEECVVPKGQGVLCVGCLKQLVHRTVRPLTPSAALKGSPSRLQKEKQRWFNEELQGVASPDDALHSYTYSARRDPYGVSRLSLLPRNSITISKSLSAADIASPQPSPLASPSIGLPSLKRERTRQGLGSSVASSLRMSMQGFRPGFR